MNLKRYVLTEAGVIDTSVDDVTVTRTVDYNGQETVFAFVEKNNSKVGHNFIDTADSIIEFLKGGWLVESKSNVVGVVYDRGDFKEIVWCAGFATTRVEKLLIKGVKNIQMPTNSGYKVVWSNPTNRA